MTTRPSALSVFYGDDCVGTVHDRAPLTFAYTADWLSRPSPWSLAAIPLQPGEQSGAAVHAFFENLLPEGELRQYLAQQRQASSLFALLLALAGDTAGGFVLVPVGERPPVARYEATSWEALAQHLAVQSAAAIDLQGADARISLAGAQDKTSIALLADGMPRLPKGASPSTHILKPNIRRLDKVWHSAANETLVMRTAGYCGLPVAEVFYEPLTQACIVRRFDRLLRPDGSLARLVQYDLCQLAGQLSDRKYEKEGGPGLADCAALVRRYSGQPAVDLRHLVQWVFFNLYVGNNDSHAKNLSLYSMPGRGVSLTPFYDLMCTRLYPGLSQDFAFSIGGEWRPGAMTSSHVALLAQSLGMRPQFVAQQAAAVARLLPGAVARALGDLQPVLSPSARVMAQRLSQFVLASTRKLAARLVA
ncbi:type II toxin-antitoxin system HipA family toxin [Aquincola tertiaricarbonis]|uniref:Type II toxin-antitoxin system HipA family toxin n=1 Tax=Aquincola tertiaricarbonis TaxID=391953 RepID=A0ABY4S8Z9_AQUTE|nr:type II toxin-antitoxin system HipA family toxin [Aquincola tertiaricarbonis]URI09115.1 type II toxin-antitoxin system HipA family toxin [Aquincola tertiaricarbonis]